MLDPERGQLASLTGSRSRMKCKAPKKDKNAVPSAKVHKNVITEKPPVETAVVSVNSRESSSRRGHFKSRLGCFNCKRRRVKCNELHPSCSPCRRLGLFCDYPSAPRAVELIRPNPSALTLEDLRFYHQFLTTAFPTLPIRSEKVWAQCAAMSHQVSTRLVFAT